MRQILQFSPKSLEVYVNDYIKHWNLTTSARYALSFVIGNNACVVWGRFIWLCLLRKLWVSSKISVCVQKIVSFSKSRVWVWRVSVIKELVSVLSESECGDILKVSSCTNFIIVESPLLLNITAPFNPTLSAGWEVENCFFTITKTINVFV